MHSLSLPTSGIADGNHSILQRTSTASSSRDSDDQRTFARARSHSRESATATSSRQAAASTSHAVDTGLTRIESYENRKIRFAPLPEITGRDEGFDGEDLSRSSSADGSVSGRGANAAFAELDAEEETPSRSIFGSWKSDTSFGGRRSADDDEDDGGRSLSSSYTAKLLRPLGFGSKKTKRSSSSTRSSGTDSLSRQSSNESDVSRGSSLEASYKSTGVPMRKTRTWDSDEQSGRESRRTPQRPRARASAIRKSKSSVSRSAPAAPDVEFNEWGINQGVGSVRTKSAFQADEDEDDGSGMAWIRKRRAQREAEERKKQEEEEARRKQEQQEQAAQLENEENDETDDAPFALDEDTIQPDGPRRSSVASTPTMSISATPKQQHSLPHGGLSMTRPALNVTDATPDESPALHSRMIDQPVPRSPVIQSESPLSSSPPSGSVVSDEGVHAQHLSDKLDKLSLGAAPVTVYSDGGSESDEDSEADSDQDDNGDDDDDESDLDDDELAREEALAEEARKTAKSAGGSRALFSRGQFLTIGLAGAERFHSASHQSSVISVTERPSRRVPSRSSTVVPPSRQSTLTPDRASALSH